MQRQDHLNNHHNAYVSLIDLYNGANFDVNKEVMRRNVAHKKMYGDGGYCYIY